MKIEFDPKKNEENLRKHGISLARAVDLTEAIVVRDDRFDELRFRVYGLIDEQLHCAAVTLRSGSVRVISLRRAHLKETKRHGGQEFGCL